MSPFARLSVGEFPQGFRHRDLGSSMRLRRRVRAHINQWTSSVVVTGCLPWVEFVSVRVGTAGRRGRRRVDRRRLHLRRYAIVVVDPLTGASLNPARTFGPSWRARRSAGAREQFHCIGRHRWCDGPSRTTPGTAPPGRPGPWRLVGKRGITPLNPWRRRASSLGNDSESEIGAAICQRTA